jgi:hypothetical protein
MNLLIQFLSFVRLNKAVFSGVMIGLGIAYWYWSNYAIYWGTYVLSSECWVNCIYGSLFGGLFGCLFHEKLN